MNWFSHEWGLNRCMVGSILDKSPQCRKLYNMLEGGNKQTDVAHYGYPSCFLTVNLIFVLPFYL